jgi:hypothetical protein
MRHIRLYENFTDELSPLTRDMFDLTSKISIDKNWSIEGPAEYEEEAQEIANAIIKRKNEFPMSVVKDWTGWDNYLEHQFKNSIPEEQLALAEIGWSIKSPFSRT